MWYTFSVMISRGAVVILIFTCLLTSSACSPAAFDPYDDQVPLYTFELFMSRTASTGTEFEHYKVLPMGLYAECGFFRRGRPVAVQQGIVALPPERRSDIGRVVYTLERELGTMSAATFLEPGVNRDLFDPGEFSLSLTTGGAPRVVKTTFDEVKDGSREVDLALKRLAEMTRGVPVLSPCKNEEFFGLGRRTLVR
jgi:hypothetical protein